MAYCKNCGREIGENASFCSECGAAQTVESTPVVDPTPIVEPTQPAQPPVVDNGGFGWGLLGCCVPIVGLILFLVWKDTKPKTAKSAGIGALVSVIISVIIYVIYFVIIVGLIGVGAGMSGY